MMRFELCLCILFMLELGCEHKGEELDQNSEQLFTTQNNVLSFEKIADADSSSIEWILFDTISKPHFVAGHGYTFIHDYNSMLLGDSRLVVEGRFDSSEVKIWLEDSLVMHDSNVTHVHHRILPVGEFDMMDLRGVHNLRVQVDEQTRKFTWDNEQYSFVRLIVVDSNFMVHYSPYYPRYK